MAQLSARGGLSCWCPSSARRRTRSCWQAYGQALASELTVLAMDCVPRISRALRSWTRCRHRPAWPVIALCWRRRNRFPRFLQGTISAAGKFPPAKLLIIGCGVAGLAAIGTAKGLGCIVRAFDTRPVCREQVESMGGEYLEVLIQGGRHRNRRLRQDHVALSSSPLRWRCSLHRPRRWTCIITTANMPGRQSAASRQGHEPARCSRCSPLHRGRADLTGLCGLWCAGYRGASDAVGQCDRGLGGRERRQLTS